MAEGLGRAPRLEEVGPRLGQVAEGVLNAKSVHRMSAEARRGDAHLGGGLRLLYEVCRPRTCWIRPADRHPARRIGLLGTWPRRGSQWAEVAAPFWSQDGQAGSASARVAPAPLEPIFDLLADPSRHAEIDGSSAAGCPLRNARRLALGDRRRDVVRIDAAYSTRNVVVTFRRIAGSPWQTLAAPADRPGPHGRVYSAGSGLSPGAPGDRDLDISSEAAE